MNKITKPNYKLWAKNLLADGDFNLEARLADALETLFDQGYEFGLNNGWAEEQDKQYQTTDQKMGFLTPQETHDAWVERTKILNGEI